MIEFIDEQHLYLVDGVLIPCVSDILHFIFPKKYEGIPTNILNAKASYGSVLHKAVECLEQNKEMPKLDYLQELSLDQYKKLKNKFCIEVICQEQRIHYKNIYAGTFDMEALIDNQMCLADIKTTAELDKDYLSWQLSFYELATGKKYKKLYAIWLPKKGLGALVEIKRKTKKELKQKLEDFINENNSKD